jgi:hypothetical protein
MRAGHRKEQEEEKEWSPAPEATSSQEQNQVKDDIPTRLSLFVFFDFLNFVYITQHKVGTADEAELNSTQRNSHGMFSRIHF